MKIKSNWKNETDQKPVVSFFGTKCEDDFETLT